MKKTLLSLVLILGTIGSTFAQADDIKLQIGEKNKKSWRSGVAGVVATDDNGYYVLRMKSSGFILAFIPIGLKIKLYLDYYSHDMKPLKSTKIEGIRYPIFRATKSNFEFIAQNDDGEIFLYHSEANKTSTTLYRSKFNKTKFAFESPKKVSALKNIERKDRRNTYSMLQSPNGSKNAIISLMNQKKTGTDVYIQFLNSDLDALEDREERLPFDISQVSAGSGYSNMANVSESNNSTILLSNNGTINILASVYVPSGKIFTSGTYDRNLISISDIAREPIIEKIRLDGKVPLDVSIKYFGDKLICSGFFSFEKKYYLDGVFNMELDPEKLNIKDMNIQNFSDKHRAEFLISEDGSSKNRNDKRVRKRLKKNKDVDIVNYDIVDLIAYEDGSSTLVAEYYTTYTATTTTTTANGGTTTQSTSYYIYGDLVFIHFDKGGDIEWIKNIDKYQKSTSPAMLSTYHFTNDSKINFVYNDFANRKLMALSVDKRGRTEKRELAEYRRKSVLGRYYFNPGSARLTQKGEFIGFAQRSRKSKMLRFRF